MKKEMLDEREVKHVDEFKRSLHHSASFVRTAGGHKMADELLVNGGYMLGLTARAFRFPDLGNDDGLKSDDSFDQPEPRIKRKYTRRKK